MYPHEVTGDIRDRPPPYAEEFDPEVWFYLLVNPKVVVVATEAETWDYDHPVLRSSVTIVRINEYGPRTVLTRAFHDHLDDPNIDYQNRHHTEGE